MSKVFDFNARDFRPSTESAPDGAERIFMTTPLGNAEIWEITAKDPFELCGTLRGEAGTDSVFRFAVEGAARNEVLTAELFAGDDRENGMKFALAGSRFEPTASKKSKNGLLRIYELPFRMEAECMNVVLRTDKAAFLFYRVPEGADPGELEDLSYAEWLAQAPSISNVTESIISGTEELTKSVFNLTNSVISKHNFERLLEIAKHGINVNLSNSCVEDEEEVRDEAEEDKEEQTEAQTETAPAANEKTPSVSYTEADFATLLSPLNDGGTLSLPGLTVTEGEDGALSEIGSAADGASLDLSGATLTERAFAAVLCKLEDGCRLIMNDAIVKYTESDEVFDVGVGADGLNLELTGADLSAGALAGLLTKLGDGCNVDLSGCTISADGVGALGKSFRSADGTVFKLRDAILPYAALEAVKRKLGDGCTLDAQGAEIT